MDMPKHTPTIQELINLPTLETAQISPDGRFIAYQQSTPDWEKDAYISQIWLVNSEGEPEPRQLTFTPNGSSQPRWSPDGRFLSFISKREEDKVSQIYRLAITGGEAERLTQAETDVQQFRWAPDGQSLAFVAADPESEADKEREKTFGKYQVENEDYSFSHLWQLTLDDKKLRRLTGGKQFTVRYFRWSPDGRSLAFGATPTPDMDRYEEIRLYQIDVADLNLKPLTPVGYSTPLYSPDGRTLFCLQVPDFYYEPEPPCLINLETGDIQTISVEFGENMQPLAWVPDALLFTAVQRTNVHLFRLNPHSGDIQQLTPDLDDGWVSFSFTGSVMADGRFTALILDNGSQLGEVVLFNLQTGDWRNLTSLSDAVQDWPLGQPETYQWQASDGTLVEGTLTKPVDFDPQKKYPLLVAIHGGPSWVSLRQKLARFDRRFYPMPLWVAKGAIILQPNYRGSIGYGADFQAHNVRN